MHVVVVLATLLLAATSGHHLATAARTAPEQVAIAATGEL